MTRLDLDAELSALESMPLAKVGAGLLRLALAHHLQSKVMGGVTKTTERRLQDIARGNSAARVKPGTRFVREWHGRVHVVTMSENGRYRWQDRDWNSLSEIARAITGTQWSGPAFFGTKARKRPA